MAFLGALFGCRHKKLSFQSRFVELATAEWNDMKIIREASASLDRTVTKTVLRPAAETNRPAGQ